MSLIDGVDLEHRCLIIQARAGNDSKERLKIESRGPVIGFDASNSSVEPNICQGSAQNCVFFVKELNA